MEFNESRLKDEFNSIYLAFLKLLPKKKDIIIIDTEKPKITSLSDVHYEAKTTFPKCFIGAKIEVMNQIMDKVKLVQQYNLGKPKESYKCYNQFIHKEMSPIIGNDGLIVDSNGSATASYKEILKGSYEMRVTSKIKDLVSSESEINVEKSSEKTLGSVSCRMRDADPKSLEVVAQFMYKALPEFLVGIEFRLSPLQFSAVPDISISSRYETSSFTLSSTFSRFGYQVCFFKEFSKRLRIATILNESGKAYSPTLGLALHKSFGNGSEAKIFVDSQHCGGFTFQKDVFFNELDNETRVIRLKASTLLDKQKRVRLGFGFDLEF